MNIPVSTGVLGSAAGAPLSQTAGGERERAAKDAAAGERTATSETLAEKSAGIGQTHEDTETSERDADGRRLWEDSAKKKERDEQSTNDEPVLRQAKDPTGMSGGSLDLTG